MTAHVHIRAILRHFEISAELAADAAALITAIEAVVDLLEGLNDYLWERHRQDAIIAAPAATPRSSTPPTQIDLFRQHNEP